MVSRAIQSHHVCSVNYISHVRCEGDAFSFSVEHVMHSAVFIENRLWCFV